MHTVVDPYQYVIHNTSALRTGVGGEGSEEGEELRELVHWHGSNHHPRQLQTGHLHGFIPVKKWKEGLLIDCCQISEIKCSAEWSVQGLVQKVHHGGLKTYVNDTDCDGVHTVHTSTPDTERSVRMYGGEGTLRGQDWMGWEGT